MQQYYKTQLGLDTLKNRTLKLNARQRRLLLLIGTEDFQRMNDLSKRALAPQEILIQLKEMGLIHHPISNSIIALHEKQALVDIIPDIEIETKLIEATIVNTQSCLNNDISLTIHSPTRSESSEIFVALSFDEIKQVMQSRLQRYCGLMAKQLIHRIDSTQSVSELKLCQMQWITALQETRISPIELNQTMQQINQSLQLLQRS